MTVGWKYLRVSSTILKALSSYMKVRKPHIKAIESRFSDEIMIVNKMESGFNVPKDERTWEWFFLSLFMFSHILFLFSYET